MEWNTPDIFLALFAALYALILVVFSIGLLFYRPTRHEKKRHFISVLIAARNEEQHIGACIRHLFKQTYDRDLFEVIVIDDRSTDGTVSIVRSFQKDFPCLRFISITEPSQTLAPKKHALNEGIKTAQGEIIVCTDADCRPEENWLYSMVAAFRDETGMVVGFSPIEPNRRFSLFENFIALDSLALASLAAASSAFGKTLTATGRSIAYRKKVFDEVGGFSKIAHFVSGDDDLLLGLVRKTRWKIAYCMGEHALSYTYPPASFAKFVNQKIRQASKGRHYSFKMIAGLTLFYLFNVSMITYIPAKIFFSDSVSQVFFPGLILAVKFSADFLFLLIGAFRFKKIRYLMFYPAIALLHPLYITIFGAWGLFGKFDWKDTASGRTN